jgi:hypothetical protein
MEHWYRATGQHCIMQRCYGALLVLHSHLHHSNAVVRTVDQGWELSHQERLFLEKASTGWKRTTTLFPVITLQNYLKLGVMSAICGRRFASQRPYGQQLPTAGYWGPH